MIINGADKSKILHQGERIDRVNDDIELIQRTDGLTFGTDALLLAGYIKKTYGKALEIGGGTGIISLLCLARRKFGEIDCCEIQEAYADIISRNAAINGFENRLSVIHGDVRQIKVGEQYDAVFTNPPYMTSSSGRGNRSEAKNAARHELNGGIYEFCEAAKRHLKYDGSLYAVYRPTRISDLIAAMKAAQTEPKRITFVHADIQSEPSIVLAEGRRGGKPGVYVTRPLIIYTDAEHTRESDDIRYIMENGSFPNDFFSASKGRKNDGK